MGIEWSFYGRRREQEDIERILDSGRWFFCAISGRRRIGKTSLIQQALKSKPELDAFYFQVPDSDERGVVQAFQDAMEDSGFKSAMVQKVCRTFADMASVVRVFCDEGWIVVIDEFQYFHRKQLAPFASFLQGAVDSLRDTQRGGLFVLGSIHTEMMAVLEDQTSPLFNRVTHRIEVGHWDFATLFEMLDAHAIADPDHWLFLWSLFEGVPKFYRDAHEQGVLVPSEVHRRETLQQLFFEGASPLRDEAANWFLRELRGRYDSVLKLLAYKEPCSYGDLVQEYARAGSGDEKQLTAYLKTLIDRYRMVERLQPVFADEGSRKARYVIADNFLASWLAGLARNVQIARIRPVEEAVDRADAALKTQEGYGFEKMTRSLLEECSRRGVGDFRLSEIVRGYWNKADGSDIEIDIVALNADDRIVRFGSCKRSEDKHDLGKFDLHVDRFLGTKEGRRVSGWTVERALYSPRIAGQRRSDFSQRGYRCYDLDDFASAIRGNRLPLFERSEIQT